MVTILVVDDNNSNRQYLATVLELANYQVVTAGDGHEALALACEKHPDLIISDIMMPTMDGYEFVHYLRNNPKIANTPVIFFTATFLENDARELGNACGVDHFLIKPIDEHVLLTTIEHVLKRARFYSLKKTIPELHMQHHRLITKKLFEESNELHELNEQLERRIIEKTKKLAEANKKLKALSYCDILTGLCNRRCLELQLNKEIKVAARHQEEFALMLLDVDHFKKINDEYSHAAGDYVLKKMSHILQKNIRPEDLVSRYGGDEFIIILNNIDAKNSYKRAERLRNAIKTLEIQYNQHAPFNITISIGIAMYPAHATTKKMLIKVADSALYKAKELGRNNAVI